MNPFREKIKMWNHLFLFLIPPIIYYLVLGYYTPHSFNLKTESDCEKQIPCTLKMDDSLVKKINLDLQNQIEEVSRFDGFVKPFSGFIRVQPKFTNKSTFTIVVLNPARPTQEVSRKAQYKCQLSTSDLNLFTYGQKIFFRNKSSSLTDVPELLKSTSNTLLKCFRGFESQSEQGKGVYANKDSYVYFKDINMDFLVEFFPDRLSKFLILLQSLGIFLGLLTLVRESVKFIKKGWPYFID